MGFDLQTAKASSSQRHPPDNPLPIEFPKGWGVGEVFDWYELASVQGQTSILRLQIRKDTSGVVPHRFVVLHMRDGSIHRFDRRPNMNAEEASRIGLVLRDKPVTTKDECVRNLSDDLLKKVEKTDLEIELYFPDGRVDLAVVLGACFAISQDPEANKYSLYAHNCFFFSWTILMVTSRYYLPYEAPSPDLLLKRAETFHLEELTNFIVDEASELFLNIVVETVTTFRNRSGRAIREGLSPFTRATWALPPNFLRFICRHMFKARMHLGLRQQLRKQVKEVAGKKAAELCQQSLKSHGVPTLLDNHLWLDEVDKIVRPALRVEVIGLLWGSIFEAICSGYGDIDPSKLVQQVTDPSLKFAFLGRRVTQFYAVWNAALDGGLRAARQATSLEEKTKREQQPDVSQVEDAAILTEYGNRELPLLNDRMFDLAWKAAGTGALQAAQAVVQDTQTRMKHQEKRDKMWAEIWLIWDKTWSEAQEMTQRKSVETVDKIVGKVLEHGSRLVIEELSDASAHSVQARVRNLVDSNEDSKLKSRKLLQSHSEKKMTNGTLQRLMQAIIKKDTWDDDYFTNVNETMSRIWTVVRKLPAIKRSEVMERGGELEIGHDSN